VLLTAAPKKNEASKKRGHANDWIESYP